MHQQQLREQERQRSLRYNTQAVPIKRDFPLPAPCRSSVPPLLPHTIFLQRTRVMAAMAALNFTNLKCRLVGRKLSEATSTASYHPSSVPINHAPPPAACPDTPPPFAACPDTPPPPNTGVQCCHCCYHPCPSRPRQCCKQYQWRQQRPQQLEWQQLCETLGQWTQTCATRRWAACCAWRWEGAGQGARIEGAGGGQEQ